jgi:hypothetical protein
MTKLEELKEAYLAAAKATYVAGAAACAACDAYFAELEKSKENSND